MLNTLDWTLIIRGNQAPPPVPRYNEDRVILK